MRPLLTTEAQSGHASTQAVQDVAFYAPYSFDELLETTSKVCTQLVEEGKIAETSEGEMPQAPMDCT